MKFIVIFLPILLLACQPDIIKQEPITSNVTNALITAQDSALLLSWKNPSDGNLKDIVVNDGITDSIIPLARQSLLISGLTNGKEYSYTVYARTVAMNKSSGIILKGVPTALAFSTPTPVYSSQTSIQQGTLASSQKIVAPSINLVQGVYANAQTLILTNSTANSVSYYSLDGGSTWIAYSVPVSLSIDKSIYLVKTKSVLIDNTYGESTIVPIGIDIYTPVIVTGINSGYYNTNQTFSLTGKYSLKYSIAINSGTAITYDYTTPVTLSSEGKYKVKAWQVDGNGLSTSILTISNINIIKTAPQILTLADAVQAEKTYFQAKSFYFPVPAGNIVEYSVDGGTTWLSLPDSNLTLANDGTYSLTIRQKDLAGNVSIASTPLKFYIYLGNLPPTCSLTSGYYNTNQMLSLTGNYDVRYSISINGSDPISYIYSVPVLLSNEGNYIIQAWQLDATGFSSAIATVSSLNIIKTIPNPPAYTTQTQNNKVYFQPRTFVFVIPSGNTTQYSLNGGTTWSNLTNATLQVSADGAYSLVARQTDQAGNVSPNSNPLNFYVYNNSYSPVCKIDNNIVTANSTTESFAYVDFTINDTIKNLDNSVSLQSSFDGGLTWLDSASQATLDVHTKAVGTNLVCARYKTVLGELSSIESFSYIFNHNKPDLVMPQGINSVYTSDTGSGVRHWNVNYPKTPVAYDPLNPVTNRYEFNPAGTNTPFSFTFTADNPSAYSYYYTISPTETVWIPLSAGQTITPTPVYYYTDEDPSREAYYMIQIKEVNKLNPTIAYTSLAYRWYQVIPLIQQNNINYNNVYLYSKGGDRYDLYVGLDRQLDDGESLVAFYMGIGTTPVANQDWTNSNYWAEPARDIWGTLNPIVLSTYKVLRYSDTSTNYFYKFSDLPGDMGISAFCNFNITLTTLRNGSNNANSTNLITAPIKTGLPY